MTNTKSLKLQPPVGAWVRAFCFEEKTRVALKEWLSDADIDLLQNHVEVAVDRELENRDMASLAENKTVLGRVRDLAKSLATAMHDAPAATTGILDLMAQKHLGGWDKKDQLIESLLQLERGLSDHLETMPIQLTRTAPHEFMVKQIAGVLEPIGIRASVSKTTKFFKISKIVFHAANIHGDQTRSIEQFINSRK